MIIDSYDEASPAKINVKKNENAVPVDAVIYTFSHEIETYVTENYACEKVGEYKMASTDGRTRRSRPSARRDAGHLLFGEDRLQQACSGV